MEKVVSKSYEEMSACTARHIIDYVKENPTALICIAAGNTPVDTAKYLVEACKCGEVDLSNCKFISLDEWVGLDKNDAGSCQDFLYSSLFDPLAIDSSNIFVFDAKSSNLEEECKKADNFIQENGPIDIMVLGIGMNGHIGFNEPGVDFSLGAHVADLDDVTKQVCQKYFPQAMELSKGITLGCKHVMDSKVVILQANGVNKKEAIAKFLRSEVTNQYPVTIIKNHPNCYLYIDSDSNTED